MDTQSPSKHTKSMHTIYGVSIIILAVVLSCIVFVLGRVQVPYLSYFYTPVPQSVSMQAFSSGFATSSVVDQVSSSSSKAP